MKPKEILYSVGLKPIIREYPFDMETFVLPQEGELSFARWRHPKERKKEFSQAAIDALRGFHREGNAAIDVGAHTGDKLSLHMSTTFQRSSTFRLTAQTKQALLNFGVHGEDTAFLLKVDSFPRELRISEANVAQW